MKKDEQINLIINDEKTKKELIYNNVVNNLKLSNNDEVKYLKKKTFGLEEELETRMMYTLMFLFSFITLTFGIILMVFDLHLLGIAMIFATFIFIIIKLIMSFKKSIKRAKSDEFDKVDELIKLLEDKLK
jgi:hypothetical protein